MVSSNDEIRILTPSGMLGYGFPIEHVKMGLALKPHAITIDAGSTAKVVGDVNTAAGMVVGGDDSHARRQARLEFDDLGPEPAGHLQGVFAVPHQDDAAHRLAAVLVEDAAPRGTAERHGRHVRKRDRRAVGSYEGDVLEVADHPQGLEPGIS